MSQDRLHQIRRGFADDASQYDEPPDLGPLRALAEREELADAAVRLADAYGRPLRADDPLRPLAADVARALAEAGLTLHHCAQHHPRYRLGGVCLLPVAPGHDPDGSGGTESPGKSFETLARLSAKRTTIWPGAFSRTEPSEPSS
jgi:hypothetical protein